MYELWASASYEPHLLSLPFALAPAAMLIVIAYAVVMRGAPTLRGFLLAHCLALFPYAMVMTLTPSITNPRVAELWFRVGAAFVPMAAATGASFQLALIRKLRTYWPFLVVLYANALVWIVVGSASDTIVDGVRRVSGFWYADAGRYAPLALVNTIAMTIPGFYELGKVAIRSKPSHERRQLRLALAANVITYAALVDVPLSYGVGFFPIGWLLSAIGSLLLVRALVVEDLLRVRAVDTAAPLVVVHFAAGLLLGWVALAQLGDRVPWWIAASSLASCFVAVRVVIATIGLVNRGARGGEGPLERLLAQLVGRARSLVEATAIAQLAIDIVELGIGVRASVLVASEQDWGWTTETGARVDDAVAPDPLLMSWLAAQRGALFADDPESVPVDLRGLFAALVDRHEAAVVIPVRSTDELLGLVVIPGRTRRLRGQALGFVERAAERLAEALLHARMARRASERAALAREVELAATVQAELLPAAGAHAHGDITLIGSWQPATRCGGDFWGGYSLAEGRVLVVIGDVTGHGVASAMVTAAVAGACEVCVRRGHDNLELGELAVALDAAVRRVGGGELAMTLFAGVLDPVALEIRFVSCGSTAPYLCRPTATGVELQALVARGNPLGSGGPTAPRVHLRALLPRDLIVWYTDGVIEAQDPAGTPYGDRRLQHLLRRLDRQRLSARGVHAMIESSVDAHRGGQPLSDDETLVVAEVAPGTAP